MQNTQTRTSIARYTKACVQCNRQFRSTRNAAKYCSNACREHAYRLRQAATAAANWQPDERQEKFKVPAEVNGRPMWLYPLYNPDGVLIVSQRGYHFRSIGGAIYFLRRDHIEAAKQGKVLAAAPPPGEYDTAATKPTNQGGQRKGLIARFAQWLEEDEPDQPTEDKPAVPPSENFPRGRGELGMYGNPNNKWKGDT